VQLLRISFKFRSNTIQFLCSFTMLQVCIIIIIIIIILMLLLGKIDFLKLKFPRLYTINSIHYVRSEIEYIDIVLDLMFLL
jgi:hypothetical protein